ncbi:hypothetical protein D3C80_1717400 [compost metagenome]
MTFALPAQPSQLLGFAHQSMAFPPAGDGRIGLQAETVAPAAFNPFLQRQSLTLDGPLQIAGQCLQYRPVGFDGSLHQHHRGGPDIAAGLKPPEKARRYAVLI